MLLGFIGGSSLGKEYLTSKLFTVATVGVFSSAGAAFDGVTSKSETVCASSAPSISGYGNKIGLYYGGMNVRITKFDLYGPNDWYILGNNSSNRLRLVGSNDGSTWFTMWSGSYPSGTSAHLIVTSDITVVTYKYIALDFEGNGSNGLRIAQAQFWGFFE